MRRLFAKTKVSERYRDFRQLQILSNVRGADGLGLLAIILLQGTSSVRNYKMLEERIRWGAEGAWTEGRCSEAEDHFSKVMVT